MLGCDTWPTESLEMPKTGNKMVVVACGSADEVKQWSGILQQAGIKFAVTRSSKQQDSNEDRVEIWIGKENLERAEAAIREL